jgi:hypothetical protein
MTNVEGFNERQRKNNSRERERERERERMEGEGERVGEGDGAFLSRQVCQHYTFSPPAAASLA